MSKPALQNVVRTLFKLAGRPDAAAGDQELLTRYVVHHDEAAFEQLVRRHGPMVHDLCRRLLGQEADADDACQAVFLVLVRKARSIRKQQSLASWLYGVAYRVAERAKRDAAATRKHERRQLPQTPAADPGSEVAWRDLCTTLDAELATLSDTYRAPLVLCYLEGQTRDRAARQLGLAVRTLDRRLERGRKLLRARLARRGVTLSAGLLVGGLSQQATAAGVASKLVSLANAATYSGPAAATIPLRVQLLANAVLKSMAVAKLQTVAALVLGLSMAIAGTGAFVLRAQDLAAASGGRDSKPAAAPMPMPMAEPKSSKVDPPRVDQFGDPLPAGAFARLGSLRFYHGDRVERVVLSPDGKLVVSVAADNRLWVAETGKELLLPDHLKHAFVFAHKGKLLANEGLAGADRLWDLATGKEVPLKGVDLQTQRAQADEGRARNTAKFSTVSPDGAVRATASIEGGPIRLYDTKTGKELPSFEGQPEKPVQRLAFSPNSELLVATYPGEWVYLWNLATRKEARRLRSQDNTVFSLSFSADGKTLAGADNCAVTLWDVGTGKYRHDFGHTYVVKALAFSPDGTRLLTGAFFNDPVIRAWDTFTGKETGRWLGHRIDVAALAVSPDGRWAASGSQDGTLRLWDAAAGKEVRQWKLVGYYIAFSPDSKLLAAAGREAIRLFNIESGQEVRSFKAMSSCLAFSPDGKALASAAGFDRKVVRLWDVATGKELGKFGREDAPPLVFAFSPDGRLLATGENDGTLRLWDVATGRLVRQLSGPVVAGPRPHPSVHALWAIGFSPDGWSVAACYADETVRLWEVFSCQERARFHGHRGGVSCLAFSPDGRTLASGSWDRTVVTWDVRGELASGRRLADLGANEWRALWEDLAGLDAAKAYQAARGLRDAGEKAVPLLREHLHPVPAADAKHIARLVADLDSDRFEVRNNATRGLQSLGELAERALRKAVETGPSVEVRRRVEALLQKLESRAPSETLRALRSVETLEGIGTPAARRVLEHLATGAPEAWLTQQAKHALGRLAKKRSAATR